jgi:hypothetical protein
VDVVRQRPGAFRGAEAEHDVRADQAGEKHDFRRQEQPQAELAVGNRQAALILQLDVSMPVLIMIGMGMTVSLIV